MKPPAQFHTQKYRQLLLVLTLTLVISPFLQTGIGSILSAALLLYTIVLIIKSFPLPRTWVSIYMAIALTAFGLQSSANLGWTPTYNQSLGVIAQAIFALYLGVAAYWIGRDIFTEPEVTGDTVRGGISVYLLLGFVWALFYGIIETLDTHAFSQPLLSQGTYLKTLYFSFTTLTTLGYGDVIPVSEPAQVLTNLEAIIGQMYSTVFIAILVGGYLSGRSEE